MNQDGKTTSRTIQIWYTNQLWQIVVSFTDQKLEVLIAEGM